ncbi:hypothetical protein ACFLYE_01160 [Chloroflexota bacterium]
MIKGKRKNLAPAENLEHILEANAGLPAWRQVIRRPRRRVAIAYHWLDDNGKDVWAEFEWRRRFNRDTWGKLRSGTVISYRRQSEKPKGGFIVDGRAHSIERPSGEIAKVSYEFPLEPGKKIVIPDDIVAAFRAIWHIEVDRNLTSQAYDKWKKDNLPQ